MENISVKIDGKKVVCEKGITYFELAKTAAVCMSEDLPWLC